jgi:hypothetical protein
MQNSSRSPAGARKYFSHSDAASSWETCSADAGFPARHRLPAKLPRCRTGFSPPDFSAVSDNPTPPATIAVAAPPSRRRRAAPQSSDERVLTSSNARQSPSRKINSISPRAERKFAARNFRPHFCKNFFAACSPRSPRRKCSGFALPANFAFNFSKRFIQTKTLTRISPIIAN